MERRFIEESFPLEEIGNESSTEKNTRRGNIATLHVWWARRPAAVSRSINFASLISFPDNKEEEKRIQNEIIKLSQWKGGQNLDPLKNARKKILKECNGKMPKVLDPFGGGGSIPLEFLRLGCETFTSDYNPVSNIILKCTLEFPQKFRTKNNDGLLTSNKKNKLILDVEKWGNWVFSETKKEIEDVYKNRSSDEEVDGYIWAKTVYCQNPSCGIEIPLMRQYWLANTPRKKIALFPIVNKNKINFKIVGIGYDEIPKDFDPSKGSVSRAIVTCQKCNSTIDGKITKKLFLKKTSKERMVAIVFRDKKKKIGKFYRISNVDDTKNISKAEQLLNQKTDILKKEWGINPIPDEETPEGKGRGAERAFGIRNYGLNNWGDLFNPRQTLALITFVEKIRKAHELMLKEFDEEYAKIISTYLALTLDRMAMSYNRLTQWQATSEKMGNMFSRQAISMVWDYAEPNASGTSVRSWKSLFSDTLGIIDICGNSCEFPATVNQTSATDLPHEDNFFDAVITDPPYYDNVPYSYLSDFFYVWLKRSIGYLYPEFFSTPLTPKTNEIVVYSNTPGGWDAGKIFFETNLKKSFQEISRVLKPNGIAVIVYAHKSTEGWETLINSLLDSGLVITGSWPLDTERKTRMRGQKSASLASSIYMICRKLEREPIGFYRDVKKELKKYLDKKLEQLWNQGISGADFFISSIGSAIEVFGKYEKIVNDKDEQILILKLLDDTREIVTNFAINKVVKGEFSEEISQMTRFYILWRWTFGEAKVPFDDALRMAQSTGIDIEREWGKGFIVKDKEFIHVLGPDERNEEKMDESGNLIDSLHKTLLLWKKGDRKILDKFLEEKGYKNSEMFKRVAQAISESLPLESTEKKWLDGFLTGFKSDNSHNSSQSKLF